MDMAVSSAAPLRYTAVRARRARIASLLVARAHEAVAALDWEALDRAPDWLALGDVELAALQRRIGAVLYARAIRLWIDGPRLAAARDLLGAKFLAALLGQPDAASIPLGLVGAPGIASAAEVASALQSAGASVLLAAMPHGALRNAAAEVLAPVTASAMSHELAESLIAQAAALADLS